MGNKREFKHFSTMPASLSIAEVADFSRKKVMDQMNIDSVLFDLFEKAKRKFEKAHPEMKDMAPLIRQAKSSSFGYVNRNHQIYADKKASRDELGVKSAKSWALPHEKPVIIDHNLYGESIGRVFDASYVTYGTDHSDINMPSGVIVTHSYHTDPKTVRKIKSNEYLTDSIGGTSDFVVCSICGVDFKKADYSEWCDHRKGQVYDGQLCYHLKGDFDYFEYSFVNRPADSSKIHFAGMTNMDIISAKDSFTIDDVPDLIKDHLGSKFDSMIRDESTGIMITLDEESFMKSDMIKYIKPKLFLFDSNSTESTDDDHNSDDSGDDSETQDELEENEKIKTKDKVNSMPQKENVNSSENIADMLDASDHFNGRVNDAIEVKAQAFATEKTELTASLDAVKSELETVTKRNKELETQVKLVSIDRILELGVTLKKPRYQDIFDSEKTEAERKTARDAVAESLKDRTVDSLTDTLADLTAENNSSNSTDDKLATANDSIEGADEDGEDGESNDSVGSTDPSKPGEKKKKKKREPML